MRYTYKHKTDKQQTSKREGKQAERGRDRTIEREREMDGWDGARCMDKVEIEIGAYVNRWINTIIEVIISFCTCPSILCGRSAEITFRSFS